MREGQTAGLLDRDEGFLGPAEGELAWAAWEWGQGVWTGALEGAQMFVSEYAVADGPAGTIGEEALRQLVRERIR